MLVLPDSLLQSFLHEDVPYGDLTTGLLAIGAEPARIGFAARTPLQLCGVEEAARLIQLAGGDAAPLRRSGTWCEPGVPVLEGQGRAETVIAAWKVAQTLVETASGIATAVRHIRDAAERGGGAAVACTRKSAPGTRALALKAVQAGGGIAHRLGLSDSILVFPEHCAFLDEAPAATVRRLKAACPERRVVVEAATRDDALIWAEAGADVLQLEKFPPEAVAEIAHFLAGMASPPLLAAAGGVNEGNACAYAQAGARLLVTSAPYWAKPAEIQVRIGRA